MGKQLVIIGGGAAGPSVAAEARRRDSELKITMIERGDYVSYAACPIPYYIGDYIKDYRRLVIRTPEEFIRTGVDVKLRANVEAIDVDKGLVYVSDGSVLPYDNLVLATGAKAVRPDIPGIDSEGVFVLRNLGDALQVKSFIVENRCRRAVLLGGGFIALEMSEALRSIGIETTMVIRRDRPVPHWDPEFTDVILKELEKNQVNFLPEAKLKAIERVTDAKLCLHTDKGTIETDLIILGLGVRPETSLAEAIGLRLGDTGAISVDSRQRTSREEIYAVGDCCEVYHRIAKKWVYRPLGDIANKQGRTAGINIGGGNAEFAGIVGAQSFKLFSLEVGTTGIMEDEARQAGYDPVSNLVWGNPVARPMSRGERLGIKLVADRKTGKLLGAQAVGDKGAVWRINCLSVALWQGLTVQEIGYLDFAYAPPFGGAWDAIHVAAHALMRKL
ncbi:MAG: FAD-dependent oxidoreductase [Syntrophales bacterium]|nr:FAD-dependent oxidoreductase [Syntrophales bacterium]